MKYDTLVVGAGLSGCVFAERIATQLGRRVLVVDERPYVGGITHDYLNDDGILVQNHGLHVFHTQNRPVFEYLSTFGEWNFSQTRVQSSVDGKLIPMPLNMDSLERLYGKTLRSPDEARAFFASLRGSTGPARNAEEMAIRRVGADLYRKCFHGYTRKWWGIDPKLLPSDLTARIVFRANRQANFQNDRYQGVPKDGFTRLFRRMLDHPKITLLLDTSYRGLAAKFDQMIFTGAIDEHFDYAYGRLPYRSMRFDHETLDVEWHQPCHQINYPNDHEFMRVFEFKHATGQKHAKTTIIREIPRNAEPGMELSYPIPLPENYERYEKYRRLAEKEKRVIFFGRLAEYKYFTMGQTVARALGVFEKKVARREGSGSGSSRSASPARP